MNLKGLARHPAAVCHSRIVTPLPATHSVEIRLPCGPSVPLTSRWKDMQPIPSLAVRICQRLASSARLPAYDGTCGNLDKTGPRIACGFSCSVIPALACGTAWCRAFHMVAAQRLEWARLQLVQPCVPRAPAGMAGRTHGVLARPPASAGPENAAETIGPAAPARLALCPVLGHDPGPRPGTSRGVTACPEWRRPVFPAPRKASRLSPHGLPCIFSPVGPARTCGGSGSGMVIQSPKRADSLSRGMPSPRPPARGPNRRAPACLPLPWPDPHPIG